MARFAFAVIPILFLTGCASKTIDDSNNLADAGIVYSSSMDNFFGKVIGYTTEYSNFALLHYSKVPVNQTPSKLSSQMKLEDDKTITEAKDLEAIKVRVALTSGYFTSLKKMANDKSDKEISEESASLVTKVDSGNKVFGTNKLSDEDKGYIDQITSNAAKAYKAGKISTSLKQATPYIAKELIIHKKALAAFSSVYMGNLKDYSDNNYANSVKEPYIKHVKDLNAESWGKERKEWITIQSKLAHFDIVKTAPDTMLDLLYKTTNGEGASISALQDRVEIQQFAAFVDSLSTDTSAGVKND